MSGASEPHQTILLCLCQWGQFRNSAKWPVHLTHTLLPVISAKLCDNYQVSLSEIMTIIKHFYEPVLNIDMLNLKSYMNCFAHISHNDVIKAGKRVDVYSMSSVHLHAPPAPPPSVITSPTLSPTSVTRSFCQMREDILRSICEEAIAKAKQCYKDNDCEAIVFMINYLRCAHIAAQYTEA